MAMDKSEAQQIFNNAFVAGLPARTFENSFMNGLLPRSTKIESISVSKDSGVPVIKEEQKATLKVGETLFLGKKGEKQYKITLDAFSENVLIMRTIDVSHGAGHIVIKKQFIATTKKEITATINN